MSGDEVRVILEFQRGLNGLKSPARESEVRCVACRKLIRGKHHTMRLQITGEEVKFADRAKKLGFTSATWRTGDSMQGSFHLDCFNLATLIWQIAFETRAVSPRRQ